MADDALMVDQGVDYLLDTWVSLTYYPSAKKYQVNLSLRPSRHNFFANRLIAKIEFPVSPTFGLPSASH
jgi:hypothetical protein